MNALSSHPRSLRPIAVVIGSRIWENPEPIEKDLLKICPIMVIDGNTKGAETIASDWCAQTGTPNLRIPAQFQYHGEKAHIKRNTLILQTAKMLRHTMNTTLIVLTYPWGDSPATRNMIHQAKEQQLELETTEHPPVAKKL